MKTRLIILLLAIVCTSFASGQTVLNVKDVDDPKEALLLDVLKLTLSKIDNPDKYTFNGLSLMITEGRLQAMVQDGSLSVMWAGIQQKYEDELLPVRIPALKGMLGHRIFIIRQGDQALFDKVKTLEDLKPIPLGQGRFWGDTAILKHNGLTVIAPIKYVSLMRMLEGGRFDYFPRAVHEPWAEVVYNKDKNVTVEKKILLIYPFAMYFYVAKNNHSLAADIDSGFRNAIEDGSFDALFFSHPMIKEALEKADLKSRLVFRLTNPALPAKTPVNDKSLWLDIESL